MNHAVREYEPVFVIVTVCVSGSSVHVLPVPDDDELLYVVGQLSLHMVACRLSKELAVWPMTSVDPGRTTTWNMW